MGDDLPLYCYPDACLAGPDAFRGN